jgi:Leucine-rich repeat (LRR) protein
MSRLLSLRINSASGGLGGSLPSFAGLTKIEDLELAFNAFTGTIPTDFLRGRQSDGQFKVRLTGNNLEGVIPANLAMFPSMILEIEDNQISGISAALCKNPDWMDGEVGRVSPRPCDAILCPAGFYSPYGRAVTKSGGVKCETCEGNLYFGETVCETKGLQSNGEVEILDLLFSETGGRYWNATHTNWTKPGVPICYREGVVCGWHPPDMNSGVTELRLNAYGLRGQIPSEIFQLPKIRRLAFSFNPVAMTFEGIERASILEIIALSHTAVSSLAGIDKAHDMLHDLNVASTQLEGSFPTELLKVSSLKGLHLDDNRLTGEIPTQISRLTNLEQLALSNNAFVGTIPTELGYLVLLKRLDVNDNRLSGTLPSELGKLLYLEGINLSGQRSESRLTGPLLPFSSNPHLHQVNASWNAFTGSVPATMLSAVDKDAETQLDFSNNNLSGKVPVALGAFERLNINLAANKIDEVPPEVCTKSDWMNGMVGLAAAGRKCDAILCKPGTFTTDGKQMHKSDVCKKCASLDEAPYYGSTSCFDPTTKYEREGTYMERQ